MTNAAMSARSRVYIPTSHLASTCGKTDRARPVEPAFTQHIVWVGVWIDFSLVCQIPRQSAALNRKGVKLPPLGNARARPARCTCQTSQGTLWLSLGYEDCTCQTSHRTLWLSPGYEDEVHMCKHAGTWQVPRSVQAPSLTLNNPDSHIHGIYASLRRHTGATGGGSIQTWKQGFGRMVLIMAVQSRTTSQSRSIRPAQQRIG